MLIHINGFPGVGKLTVARELEKIMGARLIDNHAIINLATLATERGSHEYFEFITELTDTLFSALIKNAAAKDLIFTNALAAECEEDISRLERHRPLAQARHELFMPVLLTCDIDENKNRLVRPERAERQKLTKVHILDELYASYRPYHPQDPHGLVIDVTQKSAQETAAFIKSHCENLRIAPQTDPYLQQKL